MQDIFKRYIYPIATLSGGIIGVGFLSLPYITLQVGIFPMLFYFIVLVAVVASIHVMFGQVSLKTPDFKRWPGFIEYYFGKFTKQVLLVPIIAGYFGVLLIYLIIGSQFLTALLSPFLGGSSYLYAIGYFIVLSAVLYSGVSLISRIDFWALCLLFLCLLLIFIKGFPHISAINFSFGALSWKTAFLPYGVIIFSLWGTGLIPEAEEMLKRDKKRFKIIIIIGTLLPAIFYFLFIFLVLGIAGNQTTESALVGLKNILGGGVASVALFIGVVAESVAFISGGLLLKKIFIYDLKVREFSAWTFVCFVPMILFLLGLNAFIPLISFVGGVLLGIDGVLILLMYHKIGGKSLLVYPIMAIFVVGILYSLFLF